MNINKFYKWCMIAMVLCLSLGVLLHARTFIAAFELIASAFVLVFVSITGYEIFTWEKRRQKRTQSNNNEDSSNTK
jgi:predicted membrane protein